MRWSDEAILLSSRKHSEHTAIVRLFSYAHGVTAGAVRGAQSKDKRGIYQPGNLLHAHFSAKTPDGLGNFTCELAQPVAAYCLNHPLHLAALSSILALSEKVLQEHEARPLLFHQLWNVLEHLAAGSEGWRQAYVQLELALLAESGFGLELDACAASGERTNLAYVSPKSGRAVGLEAGEDYKDRLLPLPGFLLPEGAAAMLGHNQPQGAALLDGLRLTGYFLQHRLCEPEGWKLPAARQRMLQLLASPTATETHEQE